MSKEKLIISGNKSLNGSIRVQGAKNSALPLLAAAILSQGVVELADVPKLRDVTHMLEILERLGAKVTDKGSSLMIDSRELNSLIVPEELMKEIRSSIVLLGALLARKGEAILSYPGGCAIGKRPIELHLQNFKKLGCKIEEKNGNIRAIAPNGLKAAKIKLNYPSVGATENLMMASVFSKGCTEIINPAKEPEIMDLQDFLNAMGAKIQGAGTDVIKITGVDSLNPVKYKINSDRIVAGTFMIASAITGGNVKLKNVIPDHLTSLIEKLREAGVNVIEGDESLTVIAPDRYKSIELVETSPYPGFPTDLQPQLLAFCTILNGRTLIVESIFENRFSHVKGLKKMGGDILLGERIAFVRGPSKLKGNTVEAHDLRAGAALIIAALKAEGISVIHGLEHIDRGYEMIENQLRELGGKVERIQKTRQSFENA